MACNIQILEVVGVPGNNPNVTESIHVAGTAEDCSSLEVSIQCEGSNAPVVDQAAVNAAGDWVVDIEMNCRCGFGVEIIARCQDDPTCEAGRQTTLSCPDVSDCPDCTVSVKDGDHTNDDVAISTCIEGKRLVTVEVNCPPPANGGTLMTQIDFGDGTFSAVQTGTNYSLLHTYAPPGPYNGRLITILPEGCPDRVFVAGPFDACPCPEVTDVDVDLSGCVGGNNTAVVTFTATTNADPGGPCTYHWDFGDGSPEVTTIVPTVSHTYTTAEAFSAAVVLQCGSCLSIAPISVAVLPCCAIVTNLDATVDGCISGATGDTADVTLIAETNPDGAAGTFSWDFGDGSPVETSSAPARTHAYSTTGSKTASVTFTPDDPNCRATTVNTTFDVPSCGGDDGGDDDDGGGEGGWCRIGRWVMVISAALAILAGMLVLCVPAAAPALGWIALGFAIAAAIAGILWGIFCKKPCGWGLLLAWQSTFGAGVGALYFTTCCPSFLAIGPALIGSGLALMYAWVKRCNIGRCRLYAELLVVFTGAIIPMVSAVSSIPVLAACLNPLVGLAVAGLLAVLGGLIASCVMNEAG